ncbi:MAG TPA: polysaccharide biosynthesis C-terminal domain-containing protein [Dermatophilaceae bacterium]
MSNLGAQGGALLCLSVASLAVARLAGPAVLGEYALLRVLPWLTGVVVSLGLPVASAYFLAGERARDPRLRATLSAMALLASFLGAIAWLVGAPLMHGWLFAAVPPGLLAVMAATVATQLLTVWAKACCQGRADMFGANLVIVTEELWFLPAYAAALLLGGRGIVAVGAGMIAGGVLATVTALGRLAYTGYGLGRGTPTFALVKPIAAYGARGQLGNLLWLVNLRLDFLVLGALAGPAVLGVYAVATKFAELMRLPATAVNYVLYPRFARVRPAQASREATRLLPRALGLTVLATPLVAGVSVVALPLLYGVEFRSAIVPTCLLLVGLSVEGAAAVSSAFLWGVGRPGANSWAMGIGVLITVTLDLLLIPGHGALGAAIASSAAYLVTTILLTAFTHRISARALREDEAVPGGIRT